MGDLITQMAGENEARAACVLAVVSAGAHSPLLLLLLVLLVVHKARAEPPPTDDIKLANSHAANNHTTLRYAPSADKTRPRLKSRTRCELQKLAAHCCFKINKFF